MRFFPNIKNSNMCLKRKMWTSCPTIAYNYTINLEEGAQPPFTPIYNMFQNKLIALHEYINENFKKGFIRHSKSLVGAPILFIKKKDGSF
jgi:hypothetical protein